MLSIDRAHTALLAMDCQSGIVSQYVKPPDEFLSRASKAAKAARKAGLPLIHVRVGFRPGLPEVGERNKLFAAVKTSPQYQKLFDGPAGEVHPALGPEAGDIVVTKHRVSAFAGTDLEMILRANDIRTLVMFGIATSGVVLSTLLEASDADYDLVLIADCCADMNADLHNALIAHLFPRRAAIITSDEFVSALASVD
jgi:nicotinamidase-related amidase